MSLSTWADRVYWSSPVFLQNLLISAYGYYIYKRRYGGRHSEYLQSLRESQWYPKNRIEEEQFVNLSGVIRPRLRRFLFTKKFIENMMWCHRLYKALTTCENYRSLRRKISEPIPNYLFLISPERPHSRDSYERNDRFPAYHLSTAGGT